MARFIRHLPCPKCGSKDNFAEYDTNFHCFGCKHYIPKNDISSTRARLESKLIDTNFESIDVNSTIPTEPLQWLLKQGITLTDIADNNIGWNQEQGILVLYNSPEFYQGRCFNNTGKKYLNQGVKPLKFYGESDSVVIVEDVISAIKIAKSDSGVCALPLFGSTMPLERTETMLGLFKKVFVWLDRDKASNALTIARMFRSKGLDSSVIVTDLDPKEYNLNEIKLYIIK